ncbi:Stage V sporulation protein AF (SpoVAF) [Paenibacillus pasadenensis]|uniref:Stage V sporulation protein AF (SpoVAF) n=1 Tax=Paenibacillus pasadenensis TaxID=217090 RepID=A0A2N5N5J2_9BACL|nr:spore germination protein [Paenibacillus sp. B01]PLT45592.1 Stage V sporulation protein AF (SpoVAF) [Paenibacillus pasadenensis]
MTKWQKVKRLEHPEEPVVEARETSGESRSGDGWEGLLEEIDRLEQAERRHEPEPVRRAERPEGREDWMEALLLEASAEPGRLPEAESRSEEGGLAEALLDEDGSGEAEAERSRVRERSARGDHEHEDEDEEERGDEWAAALRDDRTDGGREGEKREMSRPAGLHEDDRDGDDRDGDDRDGDERHADSRHADSRHADDRHADDRHADSRHADDRDEDDLHADTRDGDDRRGEARGEGVRTGAREEKGRGGKAGEARRGDEAGRELRAEAGAPSRRGDAEREDRAAGHGREERKESREAGGRGAGKGRGGGGVSEGGNSAPGTDGDALEPIPERIETFVDRLKEEVGYKTSFDVVVREMTLGGKKTAFFMMNGLSSGLIMTEILQRLTFLQTDNLSADALHSFMKLYVPAVQVEQEDDWNMMLTAVLGGSTGMYIDGESTMLILDARSFPVRNPEEPSLERVVRGSRDGFVETLLMNVSLVRRRLRDPMLRYEILRVGERTRSDVCIAYIDDIVDKELLESIRDKISAVKIDGLPLADKQLEEATVKRGWNPYPLVRYSERPDVVAAHLLEGNVAVFVDTSPSVMILPTTFFDLVQHAEENRQTPFIGTYLRWLRFLGILASLFLVPIWLLFALNPTMLPAALSFIGPAKTSKIPLALQFLLAEGGIDLMRMAAIHTPTPLALAISLVSAILVGDIAVQTGLFVNEVILYMAVAAVGMFATPSYELSLANRIVRLMLICLVALFHVPGLVIGWTAVFAILVMQRSFNRPYMWPFIPFDARGMMNVMLRMPVMMNRKRPNLLRPQQRDKMPEHGGA